MSVGAKLRAFARKRPVRVTAIVLASLVGVFLVAALTFHLVCHGPAEPVDDTTSPAVAALEAKHPGYQHGEESSTYLTIPEWYEVFSYKEYAEAIAAEPPSHFHYFGAIGQLWSTYCHVYGKTNASYPFNVGDQVMLVVICTSFSAEYGLKGIWEHTLGWLTEHSSTDTEEDHYAQAVAKDYGHFVEIDVWYRYPFGSKMVHLWTDNHFWGPHMARKVERRVFLTAQYGVEAGYAFVIRHASTALFGPPTTTDLLWVENATPAIFQMENVTMVDDMGNGSYVIAVPHWEPFTDVMPPLARQGVHFADLSGNHLIAMTVIAPRGANVTVPDGRLIFAQPVLIHDNQTRVALVVPSDELDRAILALDAQGVRVEHLFDY